MRAEGRRDGHGKGDRRKLEPGTKLRPPRSIPEKGESSGGGLVGGIKGEGGFWGERGKYHDGLQEGTGMDSVDQTPIREDLHIEMLGSFRRKTPSGAALYRSNGSEKGRM